MLGVLLGFLALAFAFALTVSRTLQAEVQRLLVAAQRLGRGDFSVAVPAEGNDEFAALARSSTTWRASSRAGSRSSSASARACRRRSAASASRSPRGLDRVGLLEIVVQTAVDGIGAAAGRASMRRNSQDRLTEVARAGEPETFARALHAAEAAVIDAGQVAEIQLGGASALAAPLGAPEEGGRVVGIVSVARAGPAVHRRRAGAVLLPHQPGRGLGRERRPARDRHRARRSPTSSPGCSTTAASRRS